jgi:hypothetical protein
MVLLIGSGNGRRCSPASNGLIRQNHSLPASPSGARPERRGVGVPTPKRLNQCYRFRLFEPLLLGPAAIDWNRSQRLGAATICTKLPHKKLEKHHDRSETDAPTP